MVGALEVVVVGGGLVEFDAELLLFLTLLLVLVEAGVDDVVLLVVPAVVPLAFFEAFADIALAALIVLLADA